MTSFGKRRHKKKGEKNPIQRTAGGCSSRSQRGKKKKKKKRNSPSPFPSPSSKKGPLFLHNLHRVTPKRERGGNEKKKRGKKSPIYSISLPFAYQAAPQKKKKKEPICERKKKKKKKKKGGGGGRVWCSSRSSFLILKGREIISRSEAEGKEGGGEKGNPSLTPPTAPWCTAPTMRGEGKKKGKKKKKKNTTVPAWCPNLYSCQKGVLPLPTTEKKKRGGKRSGTDVRRPSPCLCPLSFL